MRLPSPPPLQAGEGLRGPLSLGAVANLRPLRGTVAPSRRLQGGVAHFRGLQGTVAPLRRLSRSVAPPWTFLPHCSVVVGTTH